MLYKVYIRPEAEIDIRDAAIWYENQKSGLGHQFLNEFLKIISVMASTPLIYSNVYKNIRRALTHRFPFGIFFIIQENSIVIIAVMHGSRSPLQWKKRT